MMNYVLILFSDGMGLLSSGLQSRMAKTAIRSNRDRFFFNALSSLGTFVCLALAGVLLAPLKLFGAPVTALSPQTLWLGILFGLMAAGSGVFNLAALSAGPLSLTTPLVGCIGGILLPTVSGVWLFHDASTPIQWVGVVLLLIAIPLMMNPKADRRISLKWCVLTLLSALCSGAIGLLQKVQGHSAHSDELTSFLLVAFLTYFVIMLVLAAVSRRREVTPAPSGLSLKGNVPLIALLIGLCTATCHLLNLFLSNRMSAVIFFPLVNGISILGSWLIGVTLFRERLLKQQIIGFFVGFVALLLVGNITSLFGL